MAELNKRTDETELQYIWRLCLAKDSGSLNMTWDELAIVLNENLKEDKDKWYASSTYRKQYQQAKLYRDEVFSKEDSDKYINELQEAKRELQKERVKFQTEKLEYNKWLRTESRNELLIEKFQESIENMCPLVMPEKLPTRLYNEHEYLLCFGDLHYGVEFKIKGLYGEILNEYSPEICERRMWNLYNQTVQIINKEKITMLHILNLSDNMDGILRMSQLMRLRYGVVEATVKVSELLANWLNELSKKVKIKYYMVMDSNHDELRLLNGKKSAFPEENMDKIIFEFLKIRLKNNPNIEFVNNDTELIFMDLCGYNIAAIHGEVKDMKTAVQEYSQIYGVYINHFIGGHYHHNKGEEVGIDCSTINIGSVIGVDPHSLKIRKASNASAKLLCFEANKDIAIEYNLKLN